MARGVGTDAERAAVRRIAEGVERDDVADVLRGVSVLLTAISDARAAAPEEPLGRLKDELLTPEEAAKILHCERAWLMRNHHKFPFVLKLGRLIRFSRRGLAAYMAHEGL